MVVNWYIPGRVLLVRWPKTPSWEMILAASDALLYGVQEGNAPVHIIGDARDADALHVLKLEIRLEKNFVDHDTLGWTINIAATEKTELLGNALPQRIKPSQYRSFHDLNDALNFLALNDKTLNWKEVDNDLLFQVVTP